ncbi:MAG: DUF1565 domain-containing protein [Bacteroidales bacterium]|jgi:hypothetical protein
MSKKRLIFMLAVSFSIAMLAKDATAQINLKKIGDKVKSAAKEVAKETLEEDSKTQEKSSSTTSPTTTSKSSTATPPTSKPSTSTTPSTNLSKSSTSSSASTAKIPTGTKTIYVSLANGSNRNDGSKSSPLKDIQKAVDDAPEGAVILVSEGNYLGNLDRGFIKISKYVSVVGGYSNDFSQRDPIKYKTSIQPGANAGGTNANNGLFDIYVRGKRDGLILIDGFILDKGQMNRYVSLTPSDPRFTPPEGCETGILNPPGMIINQPYMRGPSSVSNQLIHGDVEGKVIIRNCVLMNGSHFGIQMGNIGGNWEIYNNVFLTNRMAACEVRSMNQHPGQATVEFHHNTVLFSWRRDWYPDNKDMGYGFRYMTGIDADVHHNIFGCSDFSALDRTYVDANKDKEAARKTSAWNNLFFNNIEADLTLPGAGKFMRVFAKQFEDVNQLVKYENNREMNEAELKQISRCIDNAYLKGFLTMKGTSSMEYNPNSSENQLRGALGMNPRGTSQATVTMYANAYPFDKATELFGAIDGVGAQKIK